VSTEATGVVGVGDVEVVVGPGVVPLVVEVGADVVLVAREAVE
jgi:hypothetical protein